MRGAWSGNKRWKEEEEKYKEEEKKEEKSKRELSYASLASLGIEASRFS